MAKKSTTSATTAATTAPTTETPVPKTAAPRKATAARKSKAVAVATTTDSTVATVATVSSTVETAPAPKSKKSTKTAEKQSVAPATDSPVPKPRAKRTVAAKKAVVESVDSVATPVAVVADTPPVAEVQSPPTVDSENVLETDDSIDTNDDSESVFNRNAIKRLVCIAGIPRMGNDVADRVNELVAAWVTSVLDKATTLLEFTKHKTLNVDDLQFLSRRYPNLLTPFLVPSRFKVKSCKKNEDLENVLKGKQHGNVFTAKRTFDAFLHDRLAAMHGTDSKESVIRLGNNEKNNTVVLLQLLAEEHIVKKFVDARQRMDKRDTVTAADL